MQLLNKTKQGNSTPQRIVDKFYSLIMTHGYHGTSMSFLAKNLGIAKASLYHYVDSKIDWLLMCLHPDTYGISLLPFKMVAEDPNLFATAILPTLTEEVRELFFDARNLYKAMNALQDWHHNQVDPFLDKELIMTKGESK